MAANNPSTHDILFGPFRLSETERLLLRDGEPVVIGARALDILLVLVRNAGEIVSRRALMEQVWPAVVVEESNLRVHVAALRKALGDGQDGTRYVTNIPGRGYCFVAPSQRVERAQDCAAIPSAPRQPARRTNLPPRLSRMVGRDQTVAEISSLLLTNRFVSIVGPGGMGKTTVALAIAHGLAETFNNYVYFVDLATVHDELLVCTAMASAAGCLVQAPDPLDALISFVSDKPALIVLDNCEHLVDSVARAAERLAKAAPNVHILTTTREALRVEEENVYLLSPLEGPRDVDVLTASTALESPSVQLFMERAAASGHRIPLSDDDARTVAAICNRLDGIALAIELAASRVGVHGIRETASLLDNRFRLLWHGRRTALPRHQTLHAMLDWSFNLLSEPEKQTLCRLSVFAGKFKLDAALSVLASTDAEAAEITTLIGNLVARSLIWVVYEDGTSLYRLLDSTRAYAAGKLADRGEVNKIARRHAQYCVRFMPSAQRSSTPGNHDVAHIDDIRAALAWCFSDTGDVAIGIDLAVQSAPLFYHLSFLDESKRTAQRALSALREADRNTERELVLLETSAMSSMFTHGNSDEIRVTIERALALANALGNRQRELRLLACLNIFASRTGDFRWAVSVAERGVDVAVQAGDPAGIALAEWMVGVSQNLAGDQAAAIRHCERGFEIDAACGAGDVHFFGYSHRVRALSGFARALWMRGVPERAVTVAHRAVDEAMARDHPIDVCLSLIYTIPVFFWIGDLAHAEDLTARLIASATRYSFAPYRAIGEAFKGELATRHGDLASGIQLLRGGLAELNADRHRTLVASFSRALAEALAKAGKLEEASTMVRGAIAAVIERGGSFELPDLFRAEGEILLSVPQSDTAAAEQAFLRSIDCARRQSALGWELRATLPLARIWALDGRADEARTMLDGLIAQFSEGFETSDLVAAKSLRDELRSS